MGKTMGVYKLQTNHYIKRNTIRDSEATTLSSSLSSDGYKVSSMSISHYVSLSLSHSITLPNASTHYTMQLSTLFQVSEYQLDCGPMFLARVTHISADISENISNVKLGTSGFRLLRRM